MAACDGSAPGTIELRRIGRFWRISLVFALIPCLLGPPGCAALFIRGAPEGYETRGEAVECSAIALPIAVDALVLAGSLLLLVLVGQAEGDKDDSLHGILDGGLWAAPSATLIASGTSLYFGGRRARQCHKAQREMRRKIEAEQRALELHPSN